MGAGQPARTDLVNMRKTLLSLGALVLIAWSAGVDPTPIPWRAVDQLTWADFQGEPDTTLPWFAMTSSSLEMSSDTMRATELMLTVVTRFSPTDSWVIPERSTPELLEHERWHFNIAELHARKLREAVARHPAVSPKELEPTLAKLYEHVVKERDAMQEVYDRETEHGIKRDVQARWQDRILRELNGLKKHADHRVRLRLKP